MIAEGLLMAGAQAIGYDATIAWCAGAGNFELNAMIQVMAYDLLASIELLLKSSRNFQLKLVDGLEADRNRAAGFVEQSLAMATALAPVIGYEKAAELADEASKSGRTIRGVAHERSGLPQEQLDARLDMRMQVGD